MTGLIGFTIINLLSVRLYPSQTLPSLQISYSYPGAMAGTVELEATSKLEAAMGQMKGIAEINSVSKKGYGSINVRFDENITPELFRFEVASAIRSIYPKLPPNVSYPLVRMSVPEEEQKSPLIIYTLFADEAQRLVGKVVKEVFYPALAGIDGITNIDITYVPDMEYTLYFDKEKLTAWQLTQNDIINALYSGSLSHEVGSILKPEGKQYNLVVAGSIMSANQLENIIVGTAGNKTIRICDLATIRHQESEPAYYNRINGKNNINISVFAQPGENEISLARKIQNCVTRQIARLPAGYRIEELHNSATQMKQDLQRIALRSILAIVLLLLFVGAVSRSMPYVFVITATLAVNLGIAILFYYIFNVQIQLYSLAGITVSLGLIIDNIIVMAEHVRHKKNLKAFMAVLAATLTTIAALGIIFFLDEKIRLNLIDFALVVIINLVVSLFCALFFVPAIMYRMNFHNHKKNIRKKAKKRILKLNRTYAAILRFSVRRKWITVSAVILLFGLPFFMLPKQIDTDSPLAKLYNKTIGNETFYEEVKPWIDKITGGVLRLFATFVFESDWYGRNNEIVLYVNGSMEPEYSVHQLNEVFESVEEYLQQFAEIDRFTTRITGSEFGYIEIRFKNEYENASFPAILKNRLIAFTQNLNNVDWDVYGIGQGYSNKTGGGQASFLVRMYGSNYDELNRQIAVFSKKLRQHPRVQEIKVSGKSRRPDSRKAFFIQFDKKKLAHDNITVRQIAMKLQETTENKYANLHIDIDGQKAALRITADGADNTDLWTLSRMPLKINRKEMILQDVAKIEKRITDESIHKINQQYIRTLFYTYNGTEKFGQKHLDNVIGVMETQMPLGYRIEKTGYNWYMIQNNDKKQYWLIVLVIVVIYFICAILLESLLQPLAIVAMIPVSYIGVFGAFYYFDFNFDMGGYAGLLLLSGLTVNAALFIINDYNILRKLFTNRAMPNSKIFIKAFNNKIIPILLTILSTVLGLVPFVVGGQHETFWFALAAGTISGLAFSLLGIYFVLPLFLIANFKLRITNHG